MAQTFRGWLKRRIKDANTIGDLARDVLADGGWKGRTVESLFEHFYYSYPFPCQGAWDALNEAAYRYTGDITFIRHSLADSYPEEPYNLTRGEDDYEPSYFDQ